LKRLPDARFEIYGEGSAKPALEALVNELGLQAAVRFNEPVSLREVAQIMADADLGVVPKRADSFGNEAYSTKIMEFMSVGVPVVVSSTKVDRHYFDENVVRFFPSGDHEALAEAMYELLRDPERREHQVRQALDYAMRNSWARHKSAYLDLVDALTGPGLPAAKAIG
jgi:glycosyltransferase involved in cell wall biosynthesis